MNPFNDEYFMKQALVEARAAASEGEVPVGAVIPSFTITVGNTNSSVFSAS